MKYPETARRLKKALDDNYMKPQALADITKINKSSISQYVNGSHKPSNISAGKMASALGVSPLWLMGFDVPEIDDEPAAAFAVSETEKSLILAYRKAKPGIQEAARVLLGVETKEEKSHVSAS